MVAAVKKYAFVSIACHHTKSKSGVVILEVTGDELENPQSMNERLAQLNMLPDECHSIRAFGMDGKAFKSEGLETNRFYTGAEMKRMGY